ncbi:MAG: hypothetical protein U0V70_16985 [Terriglobia bacterium]
MATFDKIRYAISLFDTGELLIVAAAILVCYLVSLVFLYWSIKATMIVHEQQLEQEKNEYKKNWENRDLAWKDREEELRRVLHLEKERELSQLKAEYDHYVSLLEQKLDRSRTREDTRN